VVAKIGCRWDLAMRCSDLLDWRRLATYTRRRFLTQSFTAAATAPLVAALASAAEDTSGPHLRFPTEPRERIAIASYPFRDFINGPSEHTGSSSAQKMDIKDFAAHVSGKFNIRKIEPWSRHFRSVDARYLEQFRAAVEKARGAVVNIAVDGDHSAYAMDAAERGRAVDFSKQWIDVAAAIGSPSVRTNIAEAKDAKPDLERAAESLRRVADYAATKNVVVNLENDNAVTEDPFFLVQLIEKVNSPWLHANPDFCNTLATGKEEYAYKGIESMFRHAYSICHVKAMEANEQTGQVYRVDMPKTFGILKRANYRGYCSMEFDSPGDPYAGTSSLIAQTLQYL
jgi:sugar phosphate isomerase/epimerase